MQHDIHAATAALRADCALALDPQSARPVAGGCIHAAWRLDGRDGPVFLKTSPAGSAWLLEAEADGLEALAAAGFLKVPAIVGHGISAGTAWLALEWLELRAGTPAAGARLGEQLARQHLAPAPCFGWRRDNAIGASPQPNGEDDDWVRFFAVRRVGFQLGLAERHGLPARLIDSGRRLQERLPALLADRRVMPALLHGDLWGGNWAADAQGQPVVFDPAVHQGDPECDLAMTRLFGGFSGDFYAAYHSVLPRAPGAESRERLYQLYHVLNHANLFGGHYPGQAQALIDVLLA